MWMGRGQRRGKAPVWSALLTALLAALGTLALAAPPLSGKPPVVRPWLASIVLEADRPLSELFDYAPPYTRNVPAFDSQDRPYLRSRTSDADYTAFVHTLDGDGHWLRLGFLSAIRAAYPDFASTVGAAGNSSDRILFDASDRAYNPLTISLEDGTRKNLLLYSIDHCRTWSVAELPPGAFAAELWTGHNQIDGPPFLAFWSPAGYSAVHRSRLDRISVTQPRFEDGRLVVPDAVPVTEESLGLSRNSGGSSFAATWGGRTFFVWPAATPVGTPGVPIMIASYDRATGTVSAPVKLAVAPPANDQHVKPGICVDGQGYLHVVSGSHGRSFLYTRSLAPGAIDAGWTDPQPVLESGYYDPATDQSFGKQTYLSFVCDSNDVLHIVFRQWRQWSDPYHRGSAYGALSYQSKVPGQPWSPARVIVVPPYPGYSIYYQKLSVDHRDRLWLSLSYSGGDEIDEAHLRTARFRVLGNQEMQVGRYRQRMVLVSDDHATWHLATTADFAAGLEPVATPW